MGVHSEIQWVLCSILQVETYMLMHKLCIALGVKIVLVFSFLNIPSHM